MNLIVLHGISYNFFSVRVTSCMHENEHHQSNTSETLPVCHTFYCHIPCTDGFKADLETVVILHSYLYDPHCDYPTSDMWAQPIIKNPGLSFSCFSLARGLATSHLNLHNPPPASFSGVGLTSIALLVIPDSPSHSRAAGDVFQVRTVVVVVT
jgi:hypothetical protein